MIWKGLKFVLAFVGSLLGGLLIGACLAVALTDTTFAQFFGKLTRLNLMEIVGVPLLSILSLFLAFFIVVTAHEAGHLLCGLLSGYKFVSFRIFNFTFIKENDKLRIKRFSIAGTGGQCLLSPPDLPLEKIPTGWYNFGGILANLILLAAALPFLWVVKNPFACIFLVIFIAVDIILLLVNGIPMRLGGVTNDARNILTLRKDPLAKRSLVIQLKSNAMLQAGVRPKDMPDEFFQVPPAIDYRNPLEAALPLMQASRLIDMEDMAAAYESFSALESHKNEIIDLYAKEISCELAFTALLTGHIEQARAILTEELLGYVNAYRRIMSSKQRLLCAKALYLDSDRSEAERIYRDLLSRQSQYLLKGEVASDIALMQSMLRNG